GEGGLRHVPTLVCARLARALAPPWCSSAFPGDGGTRGAIGGHRIRAPLGDRGTGVEGPAEVLHASDGGQFLLAVREVPDGSLPAGRGRGEPALALTGRDLLHLTRRERDHGAPLDAEIAVGVEGAIPAGLGAEDRDLAAGDRQGSVGINAVPLGVDDDGAAADHQLRTVVGVHPAAGTFLVRRPARGACFGGTFRRGRTFPSGRVLRRLLLGRGL